MIKDSNSWVKYCLWTSESFIHIYSISYRTGLCTNVSIQQLYNSMVAESFMDWANLGRPADWDCLRIHPSRQVDPNLPSLGWNLPVFGLDSLWQKHYVCMNQSWNRVTGSMIMAGRHIGRVSGPIFLCADPMLWPGSWGRRIHCTAVVVLSPNCSSHKAINRRLLAPSKRELSASQFVLPQ